MNVNNVPLSEHAYVVTNISTGETAPGRFKHREDAQETADALALAPGGRWYVYVDPPKIPALLKRQAE